MLIFLYFFKGVEGYLLYRALIIVFDTGHVKRLLLYIICYGIPVFVSVLTLIVWIMQKYMFDYDYNYHVSGDEKTICWLDDNYLFGGFYPVLIVMLCFNMFILINIFKGLTISSSPYFNGMKINLKVTKMIFI